MIFDDDDKDGLRDPEESGIPNVTVFLDLNDDGLLQAEEPSTTTDASGIYSFGGLGFGSYVVRALLADDTQLSTPLGNAFDRSSLPARAELQTLAGIRDVILVDLNGDAKLDLATVLYEANLLSIRLNDGDGSFGDTSINVSLFPEQTGPIALAAGDLNQQGSDDLVVINQLSGTSTILFDFNGTGFDSIETYPVGLLPSDVVIGDFDGVGGMDIAVTNAGSDSVTLMLNDGSGGFNLSAIPSGGKRPHVDRGGAFQ